MYIEILQAQTIWIPLYNSHMQSLIQLVINRFEKNESYLYYRQLFSKTLAQCPLCGFET